MQSRSEGQRPPFSALGRRVLRCPPHKQGAAVFYKSVFIWASCVVPHRFGNEANACSLTVHVKLSFPQRKRGMLGIVYLIPITGRMWICSDSRMLINEDTCHPGCVLGPGFAEYLKCPLTSIQRGPLTLEFASSTHCPCLTWWQSATVCVGTEMFESVEGRGRATEWGMKKKNTMRLRQRSRV